MTGDLRDAIFILLGAVGFVLLIACAMWRPAARSRRGREREWRCGWRWEQPIPLVRQLLTEACYWPVGGGLACCFRSGNDVSCQIIPADFRRGSISLTQVLVFTLLVSLATGSVRLAPAFRVRAMRL